MQWLCCTDIADAAVTDAKITGPISASKVEKPANVITVATSGGDFTSIQDALASLPNPNTTPVLIKVMPGTYNENQITMKSNIRMECAGRDITTIALPEYPGYGYIELTRIENVTITGCTITGQEELIAPNDAINLVISNNSIIGIGNTQCCGGIFISENSLDPLNDTNILISDNIISNFGMGIDIYHVNSDSHKVTVNNNLIKGNRYAGIYIRSSSQPRIIENDISGNGIGIEIDPGAGGTGRPIINRNIIINNSVVDITSNSSNTPNITSNIYDTFTGSGAVGMYNVKTDGTPAPLQ